MSDFLKLHYTLSEEIWRKFFEAHYARDHSLRLRYWFGALMILVGAMGLGGWYANKILSVGLLLFGLYCVLSKHIFALKSLISIRKSPHYQKEVTLRISREGMLVEGDDFRYRNAWNDFVGYRKVKPGFMFYIDKNAFFFIPRSAFSESEERDIQTMIQAAGLKRLPR